MLYVGGDERGAQLDQGQWVAPGLSDETVAEGSRQRLRDDRGEQRPRVLGRESSDGERRDPVERTGTVGASAVGDDDDGAIGAEPTRDDAEYVGRRRI